MALPQLQAPVYELTLPSNGKKIKFRSFLVKEEKLLMIANETGEESERTTAIAQIIDNCTFSKLDAYNMPIFDVEYLFLKLRSKSVGESVDVKVLCPDDKKTFVDVNISLEDIKCKRPKKNVNVVQLDDSVGVVLKYPTISTEIPDSPDTVSVIINQMESIFDADTVYDVVDFSSEELTTFVESMTQPQLAKILDFFENIPKVSLSVKVKNPETEVVSEVVLRGLDSFF